MDGLLEAELTGLAAVDADFAGSGAVLPGVDDLVPVDKLVQVLVFGRAFWRDPWSLFDLFVVTIALVPVTGSLSVLRALRVLRVMT